MSRLLFAAMLLLPLPLFAQPKTNAGGDKLSPGAALLFRNVKTQASVAEKNQVFRDLNLTLSPDRKGFVMDEYPVAASVYPTDMNKDGREELFVSLGSSALFGNTGQGFTLYIRDKAGKNQKQEDIGGMGMPTILSTNSLGYADILIGGPGFEFPVYRWNGRAYKYHRKMSDAALTKSKALDIESYSKAFTGAK